LGAPIFAAANIESIYSVWQPRAFSAISFLRQFINGPVTILARGPWHAKYAVFVAILLFSPGGGRSRMARQALSCIDADWRFAR
jgi:hypothetical protein